VSSGAGPERRRRARHDRIRWFGAALLLLLGGLTLRGAPWTDSLQAAWFDAHQRLWPRTVTRLPVTVVEIDAKSLRALGQWPWPRTVMAQLVDTIAAPGPAAIALDFVLPEADALSPERLLARSPTFDRDLVRALQGLPSNDAALGDALRRSRVVMAVAGLPEVGSATLRSAPVMVRQLRAGSDERPALARHEGAQTSLELLDKQAGGWGLISVEPSHGVLRRMPLVADVGGTLVPAFAVELLRVAFGASALRLDVDGAAARLLQVGTLAIATEPDGAVQPWFSPRRADRFVSAVDVLQHRVDPSLVRGQIVIVGATAVGLQDYQNTPLGERMPDSEIHAQLIENLLDGTLLRRPGWAPAAEASLLLASGALLLWVVPRWRAWQSALLVSGLALAASLAGMALFRGGRWLFDAASPALALLALFMILLIMSLTEASRQRRALEHVVQAQRESSARLAGELEAAQRIQLGSLPRADLLSAEPRVDLHALLVPAREVGGDLYDYFLLDPRRLFVLLGDVSGKGLPASMFMAVSKALYKASVLRAPDADIGDIMSTANAELSRDNATALFVTAFAAVLDLDSGLLAYCNAGHDNPHLLRAGRAPLQRLEDGDGPPLCALQDFAYRSARVQLERDDTLLLITDGITEAQNARGALYGAERLQQLLAVQQERGASAQELVQSLQRDVDAFVQGAPAADDLTILALRWRGAA
jgi:adenylate cyclase